MKPIRVLQFAFIVGAAMLVYSFVATAQDGELRKSCLSLCALTPNYVGENKAAPDIRLKDLKGVERQLSDLRGKTVVLEFWTTTCTACRQQMPALAEMAEIIKNDDRFAVLTVAVDDNLAAVQQMLMQTTRKPDPFPVLLDPESQFVLNRYGTKLFPETWLIDPEGVIRARFDGPRDWSTATAIDLLQSISRGESCSMELQGGIAVGRAATVCEKSNAQM
ncbi:MAG: TlpA family protein disulfide reductase [Deltaproteobacteria bacterium]|nr:TlpA family protein disulfide reductase [Deltaproteobacteria bacterium]